MTIVLFLIYALLGGAAGWGLLTFTDIGLYGSIGGGAIVTALLGQIHLFATRHGREDEFDSRIGAVESASRDTSERVDVVEARTESVETTLKHELTERRDALVSEMQQLEGLIERLSKSFEQRLGHNSGGGMAMASDQEDSVLRMVKDALAQNRIDLHLQPIVSLPQRRVAFYEGLTRLRREDGSQILPAEFLDAARRAGLMGKVDNLMLWRCVQIVRRLAERDRRIGVFCNIAAASLEDQKFFPLFLDFMADNRDLSQALIFEVRGDRFETRSPMMRENMNKLAQLGFRFSIDHAADLAVDLPRLQDATVRFVKINAQTLISHLRDPAGTRPLSNVAHQLSGHDVAGVFSQYGVTLIAEKVEDEATVLEILEYGVPFGQGHVFGAPRPIKTSLMEETAPSAEFVRRISAVG